jgi:hypothetical protein
MYSRTTTAHRCCVAVLAGLVAALALLASGLAGTAQAASGPTLAPNAAMGRLDGGQVNTLVLDPRLRRGLMQPRQFATTDPRIIYPRISFPTIDPRVVYPLVHPPIRFSTVLRLRLLAVLR